MTAPTVSIPLTYADVMAMPPGARRDELAYLWRMRDEQRRRALVREDMDLDAILDDAEDCRRAALDRWRDPRRTQAARLAALRRAHA
ncbi:hypothetical protein CWIS_09675 [Cellulomonas sp. A375-1]|uniref:hypothetical protein n=1 Tax=Cellulomonas sp. A375-1 TaxID=1672219 RepID=UPI00065D138B|nr:hypothetical protein [Cellulomonas sp. A375-1]KMM45601.1 hypothetical protein CWIS_09675 [Cellulomonas sp. A375-1]